MSLNPSILLIHNIQAFSLSNIHTRKNKKTRKRNKYLSVYSLCIIRPIGVEINCGSSTSNAQRKSLCSIDYRCCRKSGSTCSQSIIWKTQFFKTSIKQRWRNGVFAIWYLLLSSSTTKNKFLECLKWNIQN